MNRLTVRAVTGDVLPAPVLAMPVHPGPAGAEAPERTLDLGRDVGLDVGGHLRRVAAKGEPGDVVTVPVSDASGEVVVVHLVGTGDGSAGAMRKTGAALVRRAGRDGTAVRTTLGDGLDTDGLRGLVDGMLLGSYRYASLDSSTPDAEPDEESAEGPDRPRMEQVEIVVDDLAAAEPVLLRATAVATATALARDLVNEPSLTKTPVWLAGQAQALAGAGLAVRVRDEEELAAGGFGGILGVGRGSTRPPRLIEVEYAPEGAQRHVVLVGKGITFDSGGLSLKNNEGMLSMKTDMAGGAAVLGVLSALAALQVPVRVTGLVAAAENMPSGTAQRPGDVLTQYGGRTVEVLNTDAEGRLVLADAIAYAVAEFAPDAIVDLATLTGAASLGLGRRHGALYATDEALADGLLAAADRAGERLWRMPLVEDYRDALDSPVADLANIGRTYSGGSIVAALFLREFAGDCPWAHLDIAGPARAESDEDEVTKGGTGYGVRLLLEWLAR